MKKILLTAFAVSTMIMVNAQITVNSNVPLAGDQILETIDSLYDAGITTGSSGANQTWDFSLLQIDEVDTLNFIHPDSAMGSQFFSGANLAVEAEDSTFAFGIFTGSTYTLIGFSTPDFIAPFIGGGSSLMKFPLEYNDSWNDSYGLQIGFPIDSTPGLDSVAVHQWKTRTVTCDAYGTVELPLGTYNALRINIVEISMDTTFLYDDTLGLWVDTTSYSSDTTSTFEWWSNAANAQFSIATVDYDMNDLSPLGQFKYFNAAPTPPVGINEMEQVEVSIYPNPARGQVFITNGNSVTVYDIMGKRVIEKQLSIYDAIDVMGLESGTYFFAVKDNYGQVIRTEKISVIQ
ncbi:MAG: T9SS type A sorting domain-containing protein [Flavobacteriales bacterium]|nr:T9SS type A sorting domain-containing protein [Flavobacteriales bacterium]